MLQSMGFQGVGHNLGTKQQNRLNIVVVVQKVGIAKHFPSYQHASRYCLFISKFRIMGKPHNKNTT